MSFLYVNKTLRLNNLKTRTALNAKISVFFICAEAIIYLLLYNLHECNFNTLQFIVSSVNFVSIKIISIDLKVVIFSRKWLLRFGCLTLKIKEFDKLHTLRALDPTRLIHHWYASYAPALFTHHWYASYATAQLRAFTIINKCLTCLSLVLCCAITIER